MHKGTMRNLLVLWDGGCHVMSGAAMAADVGGGLQGAAAGALRSSMTGPVLSVAMSATLGREGLARCVRVNVSNKATDSRPGTGRLHYQIGQFVLGAEGEHLMERHQRRHQYGCDIGAPLGATFNTDVNWVSTLTGRVGLAFDRWLVYGKGGVAWANDSHDELLHAARQRRGDGDGIGWTAGAGVEYAFAPQWSRSSNITTWTSARRLFVRAGHLH